MTRGEDCLTESRRLNVAMASLHFNKLLHDCLTCKGDFSLAFLAEWLRRCTRNAVVSTAQVQIL